MASNAIASGSAILTANADGLKAGLDKAAKDVQQWGQKVGGQMRDANGRFMGGGGGGGGAGGIAAALLGPSAAAQFGKAGVAIAGVTVVAEKLKDTLGDMARMGSIAQAMGMTPEQFTGIAGVAKSVGEDTREFIESLVTMGKMASEAANGQGKVATQMFADLGLNAQEFAALRPDEQFFKMFEALQKLGPGLQQTRLLMNAFGEDGGKYLLPLLSKSPEQLRQMAAGFAITTAEVEKAAEASQAIAKLETAAGKLWKAIAVKAAPLVEGIAEFVTTALDKLEPFFDWFGRAWDGVYQVGSAVFELVSEAVSGVIDFLGDLFGDLFGWAGELPSVQDVFVGVFRALGIAAALAWDTIKVGAGAVALAASFVVDGFGAVVSVFSSVLGLAKELPDELRPTWVDDMIEGVESFERKVYDTGASMRKWGTDAISGWGSSAEKFDKWLDKKIAPKAKQTGKAVGKEMAAGFAEGIEENKAVFETKLAGAMLSGSKEAYSLIVKNQLRGMDVRNDPIKGLVGEAKKQTRVQEKTGRDIGTIKKKVDELDSF